MRWLLLLVLMLTAGCAPRHAAFRLPEAEVGFEAATFSVLAGSIDREARRGGIAAGVVAIHRHRRLVFLHHFGNLEDSGQPVDGDTLFDVASLTKPLVGARMGWALLEHPAMDEDLRRLVEGILWGCSGIADREFVPLVDALLSTRPGDMTRLFLLSRLWVEKALDASRATEPRWRYSNYSWATLSLLPVAFPQFAEAVGEGIAPLSAWGITHRPPMGGNVAPSHFPPQGLGPARTGRAFDPLADFLATRLSLPPAHSGFFANARSIGMMVSTLMDDAAVGEPFAVWFLAPAPEARDERGVAVNRLRGGLRDAAGTPFTPTGAGTGRFFHQDGYTGCLLWVDLRSGTVLTILTNASLDGSFESWERFASEVSGIVARGIAR